MVPAMDALTIRLAIPSDAKEIVRLIRALAASGDRTAPMIAPVTEASVIADGFGASPCFEVILAVRGDVAVGLAQLYPIYAAWRGERAVSIANLYVAPDERGGGLGRRLIRLVAQRAVALGAKRLELKVEAENPARGFYARVGFSLLTDIRCRMDAVAMRQVAEGS